MVQHAINPTTQFTNTQAATLIAVLILRIWDGLDSYGLFKVCFEKKNVRVFEE